MTVELDTGFQPHQRPQDRPCRLLGHFSGQALENIRSAVKRDLTRYPVRT